MWILAASGTRCTSVNYNLAKRGVANDDIRGTGVMDVDHEDHRRRLGTVKNQFIADLNQHAGFLPICVEAFAPGESSISRTFLGGQRLSVQAAQSIESTLTGGVCPIQPDQPFFAPSIQALTNHTDVRIFGSVESCGQSRFNRRWGSSRQTGCINSRSKR